MSEDKNGPDPTADAIGPPVDALRDYRTLLTEAGTADYNEDFNIGNNAEGAFVHLDQGHLGSYVDVSEPIEDGELVPRAIRLKIAQQAVIAGSFGYEVGPLRIADGGATAVRDLEPPRSASLPPNPTRDQSRGVFVDAKTGEPMNDRRADTIFAGRFISENWDVFEPKFVEESIGPFQALSLSIIRDAAATGAVDVTQIVTDIIGTEAAKDVQGAVSLVRTAAQALGYQIGPPENRPHDEHTKHKVLPVTGVDDRIFVGRNTVGRKGVELTGSGQIYLEQFRNTRAPK